MFSTTPGSSTAAGVVTPQNAGYTPPFQQQQHVAATTTAHPATIQPNHFQQVDPTELLPDRFYTCIVTEPLVCKLKSKT
jgi:hypothetical protein